ncbi:hypothetical protein PR202_gb13080 [Eleusine coracana subsp. coracana]|uniref:Uncharacterized protein n=1 Tax=Eleusine coracana subsp. coracana TaxID=191504 RepID=A0AAV5ET78_ELECO|nr:hypothetical protein PR202_gb13080 [Eleusine coracana subsp. coracana]
MEAESAVGSLLMKLGGLLADECARLKGVQGEVISLQSELKSMCALLQKCATREKLDVQVKAWTKEVRELAYDIEDCVDMFVHEVGTEEHPGGIKGFFSSILHRLKTLGARHNIAEKIQELKARAIEVREQRERYMFDDGSTTSSNDKAIDIDPRLSAIFAEQADLVGVDGPRDELVRRLVEGKARHMKRRMVLSIFGFGGLGKTTLAHEVRRKIGNQFDCQAYASVSQTVDLKKILLAICSGVTKNDNDESVKVGETWDEERLIEKTRELLYQKRYLVIIDDIWSKAAWDLLKCALPENNNGSRVITTTRIESVANACCSVPTDFCYQIQPLSESQSRSLFFKRIFGCADGCSVQLELISADILRKCGGLPLAIISISSLLASRSIHTVEYWEEVMASIGSGLQKNYDLESMKTILSLSYNDLPHYLKPCLLYLCIFPEDHYMAREGLVLRWIAEGFINEECGRTVEVVAESYFNELINRSLIEPVDIGYDGKAEACRLHDMMLDLIVSKANEENFITIIGPGPKSSKPEGVVRRLAIQYQSEDHKFEHMGPLFEIRSFSVFGKFYNQTPPFAFFRVLRVLSLDCEFNKVVDLNIICKQHLLKYLRLAGCELPVQLGELKCLETIVLRNYSWELPRGLTRLKHLRHLHVHEDGKLPEGIGALLALQRLSKFNICDSPVSAVQELGNLKNLKELHILWEQDEPSDARYKEYFSSSLVKLSSYGLRSLRIHSRQRSTSVEFLESLSHSPPYLLREFWMRNTYFRKCPKWIAPLNRLTVLKLDVWELEDADMRLLGELPALLYFVLWVVALRKQRIVIKGTGFQSLNAFHLWSGLPCLTFEERSMPKLKTLKLSFSACEAESYGSTHSGIEHLQNLRNVEVGISEVDASGSSIEVAEREIRHAIAKHPDNPKINILYYTWAFGRC